MGNETQQGLFILSGIWGFVDILVFRLPSRFEDAVAPRSSRQERDDLMIKRKSIVQNLSVLLMLYLLRMYE